MKKQIEIYIILFTIFFIYSPVWAQDRYYDDIRGNPSTWPPATTTMNTTAPGKYIEKLYISQVEQPGSGWRESDPTTTTITPDNETARGQWGILIINCYTITTTDINRMTDHEVENLARLLAIADRLPNAEGIAIACRLLPHWLTERNRECERQGE